MVTIASVAVATTKFLFDICECILNSGAGTGDVSLVLEILHEFDHEHVRSHMSPGIELNVYIVQVAQAFCSVSI